MKTCSIAQCNQRAQRVGLCRIHYPQQYRLIRRTPSVKDRLMLRRSIDANDCWTLPNRRQSAGYVQVSVGGTLHYAHRLSYEYFIGPIPDGMCLDHLCNNRACFNPDHLEPVSLETNTRRAHQRKRKLKLRKKVS